MFFPELISSIRTQDRVLEIGPGSTPHPRSNAFLELQFETEQDKIAQRGGLSKEPKFSGRPVFYYCGDAFPFKDREFDYVICSHVLEHVSNPAFFLSEIFRVGSGRGYLEYPLITYEYIYGFDVHLSFLKFDFKHGSLKYLPKQETSIGSFAAVQAIFQRTLESGWDDLVSANKKIFFEGVEFGKPFTLEKAHDPARFLPDHSLLSSKRTFRKFVGSILNKTGL